MKKSIIATLDKNILKKIQEKYNLEIVKKVQYREAILEIMEHDKNINNIFIDETIPGIISIEKLIQKIKIKNKRINIILFLEKENIEKINKLKKLNIKEIIIKNKINKKDKNTDKLNSKIINKNINKLNNIKLNNKIINNNKLNNRIIKNKINKKEKNKIIKNNNKILIINGNKKSGKSTIINLLLIYLLNKNKKILIINLNKKIENNYLILFRKNKINKQKNNIKENNIKNNSIIINKNITFIFLEKVFNKTNKEKEETQKYFKKFDYVLIDNGGGKNINIDAKKIWVIDSKSLGIKEIQQMKYRSKEFKEKEGKSLHIIYNKYYFNSISPLIIKNIFENVENITTIFYQKKFINLAQKISKNKNIPIKKFLKIKIEKILK